MSRIALVAGATGLVGSCLLTRLLADTRYERISVLSRRPLALTHSKLQVLITEGDYSDLGALDNKLRADDVYCCLGTTMKTAGSRDAFERVDFHMVVNLAQAAKHAGARHFMVVSAAGAAEKSLAYYSRVKGRMERTVAEMGFEACHILRPSLLMGERTEHRTGEKLAQRAAPLMKLLLRGPLQQYRPIEADEVAQAMITLAWRKSSGVHIHALPL